MEIPAPGAFPGGGVPEDHPRRPPFPRQEGEGDAGPRLRGCPVDEQGQGMILRADADGMRGILSNAARSVFAVFETI
jgi:hypothetical protein